MVNANVTRDTVAFFARGVTAPAVALNMELVVKMASAVVLMDGRGKTALSCAV